MEPGASSTVIAATLPVQHLKRALAIIAAALRNPGADAAAVQRATALAAAKRHRDLKDGRRLLNEAARRAIYGDHPHGRAPGGRSRDLASIRAEDVQRWFSDHVHPAALVVGIAAPDPASHLADLERHLAELPPRETEAGALAPAPLPRGRRIAVIDRPASRRALVVVALPVAASGTISVDRLALASAAGALSGAFTAHLASTGAGVRLLPSSPLMPRAQPGAIHSIAIEADRDRAAESVQTLLAELEHVAARGLPHAAAEVGRRRAETEILVTGSSSAGRLAALVDPHLAERSFDRRHDPRPAVTRSINAALTTFLRPHDATIVILADARPALLDALAKIPGVTSVEVISQDSLP